MKTVLSTALLLGGAFIVHQAQAACTYPIAPGKFPDGNVASREEIKAAKDQVVKYDGDMNAYLVCIRSEHDARLKENAGASAEQKAEMERMHAQKEDAAVAEVTDVVNRFNEQLKAWKARNAAEKKAAS
jgi:hypothetical protein